MLSSAMLGRLSTRMLPLLAVNIIKKKDMEFEVHPYYNLTVKILRARNIHGLDLLSKSDCYVALKLPTASPLIKRTPVVYNSSDPEWNETFQYRIHSAVKNILELSFYNRGILLSSLNSYDTSVAFDLGNIAPGQNLTHTFVLNSEEKRAELDVEFSLEKCKHPPCRIITNGVLVAQPCLCIKGTINKSKMAPWIIKDNCQINLSVPGSFENQLTMFCGENLEENKEEIPFIFHVNKEVSSHLNLKLLQTIAMLEEGWSEDLQVKTSLVGNAIIPVSELPLGKEVELSVPLGRDQALDLTMKVEERNHPIDMDMRIGFKLSKGEQEFLERRRTIVSRALKKVLKLRVPPWKYEVPIVAVLASGGGMRAMTSCYGSLSGLQQLGLLDILTYFSGISGSTWCMSMLYKDAYWSQRNLQNAVDSAQKIVTSGKVGAFSAEQLAYYFQELIAFEKTGRKATLVDLWGLIIEYILNNKKDPTKLSDQQKAIIKGQNPYPIYAAQNVRLNIKTSEFTEWVEYTPYEFGIHKYGAFIRMEDYGSKFFMGLLLEKHEEPRICFLQGIWASAFAGNIDDMWEDAEISQLKFTESVKDAIRIVDELLGSQSFDPSLKQSQGIMPGGVFTHLFSNLVKSRITTGENFNFLHGLHLHRNYVNVQEFVAWKGTHLDAVPNQLTPEESSLHLVDGGFAINSPFPLVLQPERDVDVIFSFNYSWQAPFEVLHQAQRYCEERGIPFPHIAVTDSDKKQPKECYMFLNATDPRAPIILHFPLVNETFKKYKAPGIKRETEEEMSFGDFQLYTEDSPYSSTNLTYEPIQFDRLLQLNCYNIINNKDTITKALTMAMMRKKFKKKRK
ncbi:cytosolic phospholipase A2 zeta-like isoform X1 [Pantherophis guttatus]|uniref:Phospholipase A2 n=1 Tax=Pantherophis guttatus TaxID=94885 RepID=A0A6P9C1R7_PANGU|nr:cytosolic phospholipase A2 zeta-like isoform X1 [Pantherophis guttatus]